MKKLTILLLCLLVMGCATLDDARNKKGDKCARIINAPLEETWNAIPSVLDKVKLSAVKYDRGSRCVLAEHTVNISTGSIDPISLAVDVVTLFTPPGENVAIFLEPTGNNSTMVEVVTNKKFKGQPGSRGWGNMILNELADKFVKKETIKDISE